MPILPIGDADTANRQSHNRNNNDEQDRVISEKSFVVFPQQVFHETMMMNKAKMMVKLNVAMERRNCFLMRDRR
jgi:hypothetical protein